MVLMAAEERGNAVQQVPEQEWKRYEMLFVRGDCVVLVARMD